MRIEYKIGKDDHVVLKGAEADCEPGEAQTTDSGREPDIDFAWEGAYHEAGHAMMHAYLKMPFVSVTVEYVPGVHAVYTHVVPRRTTSSENFIKNAMYTAAGRVATDIYAESDHGMTRWEESDVEDQRSIDAQAWQMCAHRGLNPYEWKAGIYASSRATFRIPYVWAAVEELAWQLLESAGEYAIPAKDVRRILRKAKDKDGGR
jgi:hypothetical protein